MGDIANYYDMTVTLDIMYIYTYIQWSDLKAVIFDVIQLSLNTKPTNKVIANATIVY